MNRFEGSPSTPSRTRIQGLGTRATKVSSVTRRPNCVLRPRDRFRIVSIKIDFRNDWPRLPSPLPATRTQRVYPFPAPVSSSFGLARRPLSRLFIIASPPYIYYTNKTRAFADHGLFRHVIFRPHPPAPTIPIDGISGPSRRRGYFRFFFRSFRPDRM